MGRRLELVPPGKPVLVLDLDDTVFPGFAFLADAHNAIYGTSLAAESFTTYEFWRFMGCRDEREGQERVIACFQHELLYGVRPLPGAAEGILELSQYFTIVASTGRPIETMRETRQQVARAFPTGTVCRIFHSNKHLPEWRVLRKRQICDLLGAHYLLDDCAGYIPSFVGASTQFLLFGQYLWNEQVDYKYRLSDWAAVMEFFRSKV